MQQILMKFRTGSLIKSNFVKIGKKGS